MRYDDYYCFKQYNCVKTNSNGQMLIFDVNHVLMIVFVSVNVPYFWTSGRLCDFDGCDRPDFFPKNINGWFWSANQARLAPTDSRTAFHDWSGTGG